MTENGYDSSQRSPTEVTRDALKDCEHLVEAARTLDCLLQIVQDEAYVLTRVLDSISHSGRLTVAANDRIRARAGQMNPAPICEQFLTIVWGGKGG
jgi:hypothetical protein